MPMKWRVEPQRCTTRLPTLLLELFGRDQASVSVSTSRQARTSSGHTRVIRFRRSLRAARATSSMPPPFGILPRLAPEEQKGAPGADAPSPQLAPTVRSSLLFFRGEARE